MGKNYAEESDSSQEINDDEEYQRLDISQPSVHSGSCNINPTNANSPSNFNKLNINRLHKNVDNNLSSS